MMAICFARLKIVQRSQGKNIVLKASYNSKSKLEFEGNCVIPPAIYNWTKQKKDLLDHRILLPENVDKKFFDPEYLWNSVEKSENRKDSQVGKEILLALPDDKVVSDLQRIEMAHRFSQKYFISKGYGVQVDIHKPSQRKNYEVFNEDDEINHKNYHAHILITERKFDESGLNFKKQKSNDLLPEVRGENHLAFGGIEWGKIWTQFQNEYFEEKGLDLRVDQPGIEPQIHLGPVRMRGKRAYEILDLHDAKADNLQNLIIIDSNLILKKLIENKSVFLESDLEIFLQKNIKEENRNKVRELFWKNPFIIQLFENETLQATSKFTTIEVFEEERKIIRLADRMHQKLAFSGKNDGEFSTHLSSEQKVAFEKVKNGKALSCIEGFAGTGKSYLLVALKNYYESNGYRVRAFGPDNATVKVLKEKGFKDPSNVHQFLFKNHFSKRNLIEKGREIWIVDESSKLANPPLIELLKSAEKNNIQIVFSGNSTQLSSVERGGIFKEFCNRYGCAYLTDIQRQKKSLDQEISKKLAYGDIANAINMIASTGGFQWTSSKEEALLKVVENWSLDSLNFPYASRLIIAHTNKEVRQLNDLIHTLRIQRKEVSSQEFECQTIFGKIRVSEGDLIEIRMNSKELKVQNGQVGVLVSASKEKFVLQVDNKKISFNPNKFTSYQLAYATTYFRSQGRTIDRSYIVYSPDMNQKLLYVGMTRHVQNVNCVISKTDATCLIHLKRQLVNSHEIDNTLKYTNLEEIEKLKKNKQRENLVNKLCNSDNLITKTKGYGFKGWNSFKSGISSLVERMQDRQSDLKFYEAPKPIEHSGRVVIIPEEKLTLPNVLPNVSQNFTKSVKQPAKFKKEIFGKLPEDKKLIFIKYLEKSDYASSLHTIVQSEATNFSITKESTPSFEQWQKACGERNQAAFELCRNVKYRSILGEREVRILQDRAQRYEQSLQSKDSIENQLRENIDNLLFKLFPEGPQRKDTKGFRFGSNGSLFVSCVGEKKGYYFDFENQEGGNLLNLIEKKEGLDRAKAILWAHEFLQNSSGKVSPSQFSTKHFVREKDESWISLNPPLNPSIPTLDSLSRYLENKYKLSSVHPYHNSNGDLIYYTLRLESKENGKKIVLPLSYGRTHIENEPSWKLKSPNLKNELLYNGQLLKQYPEKPILIVEGEKTADAANKLLGKDYLVVSWAGGAGAAKEANWKLLFGRDVVIWPDNDHAGYKAASEISSCLRKVGVSSLKVVSQEMLKDFPPKWDLADPIPSGKSSTMMRDCILRAESKAISLNYLKTISSQYKISFQQLNEMICNIDDRLRSDLENRHSSKSWEVEKSILEEAYKILKENSSQSVANLPLSKDKKTYKDRSHSIDLS